MKNEVVDWVKSIAIALLLVLAITYFIGSTKVYGNSMYPTLENGDFLITLNNNNIERGDIVIFQTNIEIDKGELNNLNFISRWRAGEYKKLIKRVIAVEGDSLTIKDGKVILNGEELDENYINGDITQGNLNIDSIPENKVFVMGDNRGNSLDSRTLEIGLVDLDDIIGKTLMRVFPLSGIGIIN